MWAKTSNFELIQLSHLLASSPLIYVAILLALGCLPLLLFHFYLNQYCWSVSLIIYSHCYFDSVLCCNLWTCLCLHLANCFAMNFLVGYANHLTPNSFYKHSEYASWPSQRMSCTSIIVVFYVLHCSNYSVIPGTYTSFLIELVSSYVLTIKLHYDYFSNHYLWIGVQILLTWVHDDSIFEWYCSFSSGFLSGLAGSVVCFHYSSNRNLCSNCDFTFANQLVLP